MRIWPNPDPSKPDYCPECGRENQNLDDVCPCGHDFRKDSIELSVLFALMAIVIVAVLILGFWANSCSANDTFNVNVFGINVNTLMDAEAKDYSKIILGGLTCMAVHEAGHILYCKMSGIKYDFDLSASGANLYIRANGKKLRHAAMAGYIGDSAAGIGLALFCKDSYFTKGYNMAHSIGVITYNIRNKGANDFKTIEDTGGNGDAFRCYISAISAGTLLLQN